MRTHTQFTTAQSSYCLRGATLSLIAVISAWTAADAQPTKERVTLRDVSPFAGTKTASGNNIAALSRNRQKVTGGVDPDQDVRVGMPTVQYIDPEFSSSQRQIVFQNQTNSVWIGNIDPLTGLFRSPAGEDYLMATGAASLMLTANGPEWGRAADRTSVYFTKVHNFTLQLWRSTLIDGTPKTELVTEGLMPRRTVYPSANSQADTVKLLYLRGPAATMSWAWLDESTPGREILAPEVLSGVSGPRWIPGTDEFVCLVEVNGEREIAKINATTGFTRILTNDGGKKVEMLPFRAPEFDNETLVFANIDESRLVIYRDNGGPYYEPIATLTPPPNEDYRYMVSVEPLAAGGRTYFSLEMHKIRDFLLSRDSSIWVFDMNPDPQMRIIRRVDDGSVAHRLEAEWFIGTNEVFIYYSLIDNFGRWELHRTHTGILTHNPAIPADLDGDGDVDEDDEAVLAECFAGVDLLPSNAACLGADLDGNGSVNENDMLMLEKCMSGPYRSVRVDCTK